MFCFFFILLILFLLLRDTKSHSSRLVMCRLGSARKPRLRLGFSRLRLRKIKALAMAIGLGRLRLGLSLDRGLWENGHMTAHPTQDPDGDGQIVYLFLPLYKVCFGERNSCFIYLTYSL